MSRKAPEAFPTCANRGLGVFHCAQVVATCETDTSATEQQPAAVIRSEREQVVEVRDRAVEVALVQSQIGASRIRLVDLR